MDAITFWQLNGTAPLGADYTVWNARYTGTLDDYATYEAQIRDGFQRHATRKGQSIVTVSVLPDGDGFIVLAVTR